MLEHGGGFAGARDPRQENNGLPAGFGGLSEHSAQLLGGEHGGGIVHRSVVSIAALLRAIVGLEGLLEGIGADVSAAEGLLKASIPVEEGVAACLDRMRDTLLHVRAVRLAERTTADWLKGHGQVFPSYSESKPKSLSRLRSSWRCFSSGRRFPGLLRSASVDPPAP
jgi:hypothetical protein